jgi:2,3-bisphosphoglycerate-independent phosphoglycerate mutase
MNGVEKVFVHCFMDGRDVSPVSGAGFIKSLQDYMKELGLGKVATVMGRYYAMDRDNRWERVEKAYNAITLGEGKEVKDAVKATEESYKEGVTDEFIVPFVVTEKGEPVGKVEEGDSIIFFNFRPDRAREITRTLVDPDFDGFERPNGFFPLMFVTLTQYDKTIPNVLVAFKPQSLVNTFGEYISKQGYRQLRIAETEKYAHVTFFFNGGVEAMYEGEDRALIPSPKVATYDATPAMSAPGVTDELLKRMADGSCDCVILNYANCDMVGHTGVLPAAISAVEVVDKCIGRVVDQVRALGGAVLIVSDHGNAEEMIAPDGKPHTAHTCNPVPCILVDDQRRGVMLRNGILADVAPTLLDLLELPTPPEMTGRSLIDGTR